MRLLSHKQATDGWSVQDYATWIRTIAAAAFPNDPDIAQEYALLAFVGGLTDKTTAAALLGNPPADLAAVVEMAD